jgi:hypothetical protein
MREEAGRMREEMVADEYLRNFIRSATQPESDGTLSVTINTSGLVITGRVCSEGLYREAMGEIFSLEDLSAEEVRAGLQDWFGQPSEERDEPTGYIHLLDTKIMRGLGGAISLPAWRGRLDSIVGFSLGGLDV